MAFRVTMTCLIKRPVAADCSGPIKFRRQHPLLGRAEPLLGATSVAVTRLIKHLVAACAAA